MSKSLLDLRQSVGLRLGDMLLLTAGGTINTDALFCDPVKLVGPNAAYQDRELTPYAGTSLNLGASRVVVGSSQSSRSLSLSTQMPAPIQPGDQAELWNRRGVGWTAAEVNAAINAAVEAASPYGPEVLVTLPGTFAKENTLISLPGQMTHVTGFEYQDFSGFWHRVSRAKRPDGDGWFVQPGLNGRLTLAGHWSLKLDQTVLRVAGYAAPEPLLADEDTTNVSAQWLLEEVIANLLAAAIGRPAGPDQAARERLFLQQRQRADRLRPFATVLPQPNTQRVRA